MVISSKADLAKLLSAAKEAHTAYEAFYAKEGQTPPEHKWEDWYANYVFTRLSEEDAAILDVLNGRMGRPYRRDDDEAYRQDMINAGRGHLLR